MTNIKTIKTAFGRSLHYVEMTTYADALHRLTGKKTLMIKILLIYKCS